MKSGPRVLLIVEFVLAGVFLAGNAHGQSAETPGSVDPDTLTCSPAPCVLPPTQGSEGGYIVTDSPIVSNPANLNQLLLGSYDLNCAVYPPWYPTLGFHLSRDGGSTWTRVVCMTGIGKGKISYGPLIDPSVAYDRKGTAYVAGLYWDTRGYSYGLVGLQKSSDGTNWSKPVIALRRPGKSFPDESRLTADTSPSSPRVNALYVSGVVVSYTSQIMNQVWVSHSTDGGATWKQVAVDSVQTNPEEDWFTRNATGRDGTVYVTWLHCRGTRESGLCPTVHMMFSKSADGGNTWSPPRRMATVKMPYEWVLPNDKDAIRVENYPGIAVDNSNGPHSGSLYAVMYTWTGSFLKVQAVRSTDGGKSWSQPVPVAPKSDTHDQFFPAISVSPAGLVGVSWLDRRNDPKNHDYQAFGAISKDGGQSFQPNWQLTKAFSDPDKNGSDGWMGDYTGNTWRGEDAFIAAWMDSSNGVDMQEVVGGVRLK